MNPEDRKPGNQPGPNAPLPDPVLDPVLDPILDKLAEALQRRRCKNVLIVRHSPQHDAALKNLVDRCRPPPDIEIAAPSAWLEQPHPERRYSMGIVWDFPFTLPDADAERLLARLRDLDCEAVYVRCLAQPARLRSWSERLRALGFVPLKKTGDEVSLFCFDIYDYKRVPDWLNSRFWANPHMWNKARW